MDRTCAALAASLLCAPLACMAQATVPERYGYCFAVDVPLRALWTTPVYELDIPYGRLLEQTEQDKVQFRALIAQRARLAADTDAICTYNASRAQAEQQVENTRKSFRFSRVDWTQVPWTPSPVQAATVSSPSPPAVPIAPAPRVRSANTGDVESDFWNRIADSRVAEDYDDYLQAFPNGPHAPIARLEAKRLRRGDVAPAAATPPTPAPAAPPVAGAGVAAQLASDPFYRVPAGSGATITWSGKRVITSHVGEQVIRTPVAATTTVRRDGDACEVQSHVEAGNGDTFTTDARARTWAGLLPLDGSTRMASKYATTDVRVQADALRHGAQPLFPLQPGAIVEFGVSTRNLDAAGKNTPVDLAWSCRVGQTVAAASLVPGTPGDATELSCDMRFPAMPTVAPTPLVLAWFADAGCFVQDPTRP